MSSGLIESFKVRSTLSAYRIVCADTAGSGYVVAGSAANVLRCIGVTADTVKDTTNSIPVIVSGIAKVLFNETMSTGSEVSFDSSGRGIPLAAETEGAAFVGILIGPNVAQTGTIADVLVQPGWKHSGA